MRAYFVLLPLVSLAIACDGERPKKTITEPKPEPMKTPETPGGKKVKMGEERLDRLEGPGSLSDDFPELEIETKSSFANDRGMMTSIVSVKVKGKKLEDKSEVLAAIIAARGGWSSAGESSDDDILRTAEAFVRAWAGVLDEGLLSEPEAPEDFTEALKKAPQGFPKYHPPKAGIYKLDNGERIVAVAYFERGYVGMRGRNWSFNVPAFRVKDGKRFYVRFKGDTDAVVGAQPADPDIPRPMGFSERG